MLKIIEELKEIRIKSGITFEELEYQSNYSQKSMRAAEAGKIYPILSHFVRWASALGYDVVLQRRPHL